MKVLGSLIYDVCCFWVCFAVTKFYEKGDDRDSKAFNIGSKSCTTCNL